MDNLPQELLGPIISHVADLPWKNRRRKPRGLASYTTVSRRWQRYIEPFLFREFNLHNTSVRQLEELELFRPSEAHRRAYVEQINLSITLLADDVEDADERARINNANDYIFSDCIHRLFRVLASIDGDETEPPRRENGRIKVRVGRILSMSDDPRHEYHRRLMNGAPRLRFKEPELLPAVRSVGYFSFDSILTTRLVEPASLINVARKVYGLESCFLRSSGDELLDVKTRGENRLGKWENTLTNNPYGPVLADSSVLALSEAISNCEQLATQITLFFRTQGVYDEAKNAPNILTPCSSSPSDPLSISLHSLIKRSKPTRVTLGCTVISPELFWPLETGTVLLRKDPNFWSKLKYIDVTMGPYTPRGEWYFLPDPRVSISPTNGDEQQDTAPAATFTAQNTFRTVPNPMQINPLLMAMARAAFTAPELERMILSCRRKLRPRNEGVNRMNTNQTFTIDYGVKGHSEYEGDPPIERTRLLVETGHSNWRLDQEVERCWRDVLGDDGEIVYGAGCGP